MGETINLSMIKSFLWGNKTSSSTTGCNQSEPQSKKVPPPPADTLLLGAFANHATDADHLDCLESALGQRLDLSLRFIALRDIMKSPLNSFPREEAELMKSRGGSLYLRVKIGQKDLVPYAQYKYVEALKVFTNELEDYSGPIIIEPYFDAKASSADASQKGAILKILLDSLKPYSNITWVWNPALGKMPQDISANWTSLNCTQKYQNGKWTSFEESFTQQFAAIDPAKPVMLFVAAAAPLEETRQEFISQALAAALKEKKIKGVILFSAPIVENAKIYAATIPEKTLADLKSQLQPHSALFSRDISGNLEQRPLPNLTSEQCRPIRQNFYTQADVKRKRELEHRIKLLGYKLEEFKGGIRESSFRQALAQAYIEMTSVEKEETAILALFDKALQVLKEPLDEWASLKSSGKKPNRFPIVSKYIDIKLQLVTIHLARSNTKMAEKLYQEILVELDTEKVRVEQQIDGYQKAGSQNRTYLELALLYEAVGKVKQAQDFFVKAETWTTAEEQLNRAYLSWKGESRSKQRYIAAKARIGLVRTTLLQTGQVTKSLQAKLKEILTWEEAGSEDGFMDLGIAALIYLMRAYRIDNPEKAKSRFNQEIPWEKVNQYEDLKKSLEIENVNLTSEYINKWDLILESLANVELPDANLRTELRLLKSGH